MRRFDIDSSFACPGINVVDRSSALVSRKVPLLAEEPVTGASVSGWVAGSALTGIHRSIVQYKHSGIVREDRIQTDHPREERTSLMPESLSATPPNPPRALSVIQLERGAGLTGSQPRASASRRAREESRRALARQHALVAAWLRDLHRDS